MKKTLLFALLAVMVAVSCKKSDRDTPTEPGTPKPDPDGGINVTTGVVSQNGWLKFSSLKDFKVTMAQLHSYPVEKLQDWDKFANFESLRKKYDLLDANANNGRQAPGTQALIQSGQLLDCPDSRFATVLSSNGHIQIADTLYVFPADQTDGKSYAVPERYIDDYLKGQDVFKMDGVATHFTSFIWTPFPNLNDEPGTIVSPAGQSPICSYPDKLLTNWWGQKGGDLFSDNNNVVLSPQNGQAVKLNYYRWRVGYGFYSSVGVRVKLLKYSGAAGWLSNTKFKEASLESCIKGIVQHYGKLSTHFSSHTVPGFTAYDTGSFEHTLYWSADPIYTAIFAHNFNFRFKVKYGDRIIERFIRE